MKKEIADKILGETETGYNSISKKFSETRRHFWRGLEYLKDYCVNDGNVLDYGCGNGRLLELIGDVSGVQYYGLDVSQGLIDFANNTYQGQNIHFSKINPVQVTLPFKDNFFNTIYSIAVFHHFPSKEYRQKIAKELYRTTASNGHIVVTVWYLWQKKYFKNIFENWKKKIKGESNVDWNDCLIPFTDNEGKSFERFHHAFSRRELQKLFSGAGFKVERCQIVDGRNIVLIAHK